MSRLSEHWTSREHDSTLPEYSQEERRTLLRIAHRSILTALGLPQPPEQAIPHHLAEPRGVFTTLYLRGGLRGCVGYPLPVAPLHRAVAETARSAALDDCRFSPVTVMEGPELKISLSVLSRLFPIQPEQVEVGRHGLIIALGAHRGLLLPQVPVEADWDRETFLAQTCRKAGLPSDSWNKGAELQAFTAEVFGDEGGEDETKEKGKD